MEVCLANPQCFYVTEVLGPACIAMAKAEPPVHALTRECAQTKNFQNSLVQDASCHA